METMKAKEEEVVFLTVNVPRWVHAGFKQVCQANHLSMRAVLEGFVRDVLKVHGIVGPGDNGAQVTEGEVRLPSEEAV